MTEYLRKVFELHFGIYGMAEQAAGLGQIMGEASAMGVFLQDRMVSRMLRPYEGSHVKESVFINPNLSFLAHLTVEPLCVAVLTVSPRISARIQSSKLALCAFGGLAGLTNPDKKAVEAVAP